MKRKLITSALPYVNNVPHLGTLIQVLSADVFARFCRIRGYETLYICGTDEYGTATETKAAKDGVSPRELCDKYYKLHDDIYRWFNIAFDKFGRTSTPIHTEVTQDIFKSLESRGFIDEQEIEQLYCASCDRFLADRYVKGQCPACNSSNARGDQCEDCGKLLDPTELVSPECSVCSNTPKLLKTKHLYIKLPQLKDELNEWIKKASIDGFWAKNAIQMTNAWIRDGLRERAITRDLKWGIPVPKAGYENKVFYVWFDAPIGYISITGNLGEERGEDWREFVKYWWQSPDETELFQFIGKDNIPFHTVVFPSSLLGSGKNWTMLHHMASSEFLNYESGKFSKSRGTGVFGTDAIDTGIPADVWRFYIFYNRPEKSDYLFTWNDFQEKVNGQLIGNLGNLINRTVTFISRFFEGKVPEYNEGTCDEQFTNTVTEYENKITLALEKANLRDALHLVFELCSFANKTFQEAEPWKTIKTEPSSAASLMTNLAYLIRDIAILIHPYMPGTAEQIASFFGLSFANGKLSWDDIGKTSGLDRIVKSEVLFTKLEDDAINEFRNRFSGDEQQEETPISKKFLELIDLRVAKIIKVERHPKADKLYIETVETIINGEREERIIVSGLVPFFKEEDLLNKKIILAYNLKPAVLRGVESNGMLLAVEDNLGPPDTDGKPGTRLEVLDAGDAPLGTRVGVEGEDFPGDLPGIIDVNGFFSLPINVKDHLVSLDGKALTLEGKRIETKIIPRGEVH